MRILQLSAAAALVVSAASDVAADGSKSYQGHRVYRVPMTDEQDGSHIQDVINRLDLQVWQPPAKKGAFADLQVSADQLDAFHETMKDRQLITMHQDLGASIKSEAAALHTYAAGSANTTWFDSYHTYSDHLQWLNDIASQYSKNAKIVTSGKTLEGESITGLHIFGSSQGGSRPAVVFHGTTHAREWIAAMVVEYMAHELISKYGIEPNITAFVDKYDFYIFPIVNVDGFKYTQTKDRLWRKNRQTNINSTCIGRDINRNWDYKWDTPDGSSTDPCDESFRGDAAGDAPETKALSEFLLKVKAAQGVKLFIDYHSYAQLFMTPYGYSCQVRHPNDAELQALAQGAAHAIFAVHGTKFRSGTICWTIYQASGGSVDYVADVVRADYAFASELRDKGLYGFLLPPDQIVPSGEESFAGVEFLLENMK